MTVEQLTLSPEPPRARATDPATSRTAGDNQAPRLSAGRELALRGLGVLGEATDFQLADATGRPQTSIGCRRHDLVTLGLAEPVPGRTRPSPTGAAAQVWRLTEAGRDVWRRLTSEAAS